MGSEMQGEVRRALNGYLRACSFLAPVVAFADVSDGNPAAVGRVGLGGDSSTCRWGLEGSQLRDLPATPWSLRVECTLEVL